MRFSKKQMASFFLEEIWEQTFLQKRLELLPIPFFFWVNFPIPIKNTDFRYICYSLQFHAISWLPSSLQLYKHFIYFTVYIIEKCRHHIMCNYFVALELLVFCLGFYFNLVNQECNFAVLSWHQLQLFLVNLDDILSIMRVLSYAVLSIRPLPCQTIYITEAHLFEQMHE